MPISKIISGGQTGVDRGAIEAAHFLVSLLYKCSKCVWGGVLRGYFHLRQMARLW